MMKGIEERVDRKRREIEIYATGSYWPEAPTFRQDGALTKAGRNLTKGWPRGATCARREALRGRPGRGMLSSSLSSGLSSQPILDESQHVVWYKSAMGLWGSRVQSLEVEARAEVPVRALRVPGDDYPTWRMVWGPIDASFGQTPPPWAAGDEGPTDAQERYARRLGLESRGHSKASLSNLISWFTNDQEEITDVLKRQLEGIEINGANRSPRVRWHARHIVAAIAWTIGRARWKCPSCRHWITEPAETQCDCGATFEHHAKVAFEIVAQRDPPCPEAPTAEPATLPSEPAAASIASAEVLGAVVTRRLAWADAARFVAANTAKGAAVAWNLARRLLRTQNRWSTASMVLAALVCVLAVAGFRWLAFGTYATVFALAVMAVLSGLRSGHGLAHAIGAVVVGTIGVAGLVAA